MVALFGAACSPSGIRCGLDGVDAGGVSLGLLFVVAAVVLFGWEAGVIVFRRRRSCTCSSTARRSASRTTRRSTRSRAARRRARDRPDRRRSPVGAPDRGVALGASVNYWVVNIVLISGGLAVSSGKPFMAIAPDERRRGTTVPFGLMASAALMLVVLWERSPLLSFALIGPLLAIALYQRSTYRALRAMRLALTDPLTGLGNHRHFHERLQRELPTPRRRGTPLTLCLVDIDDFKRINDRYGHPVGRPRARPGRRRGCARAARRSGSAATSSPSSCPAMNAARRFHGRALDRRARRGADARSRSAA